jgi:hypothetical protein
MAYQQIPLDNSPNQSIDITLEVDDVNINLSLFIYYNAVAGYWVMDIQKDGVDVLVGVPFVTGLNLLEQYAYLGIGSTYLVKAGETDLDYPDDSDGSLGTDFVLVWGDTVV